ncbi:hypothetical protein CFIO01_07594 [Colletotrichum fioriniae PJ7]|uniref:Heterokaryon incompatibility domain-containing protein n=1 Tax=Colletotrichum fioriniae PJ7 TaxID=1445577 RepID=A0A010RZH3_9PEZI|nr:hypothetical protein CFIO01_07594 [Colletotrichum fioriniae PJ7]
MPLKNMGYYFMTYPLTERTLDCDSNMSTDTTFLCSICKQVVQPTSSDSTSRLWVTPPDQTLDAFRQAVLRDCFICSKLWNLKREYEDLFSFDKIDESTGSTGTLDLAHSWFSECFHGHDQCKRLPTSAVNWLPTRLVDIGSRGETTWRLVVTSENSKLKRYQPRPQYMTLSYRWGTEPQKLVLSSHNLDLLGRGSPIVQLPQTFQDLIVVAHHLGIRNDNETEVEGLMPFDTLDLWIDMVATYSKCEFSVKEDKLYALGGIAKLFQEVTGDTYLAGLWRSRLLHQLDWYTLMPQPRIMSKYRAPSWSWASVDGPVQPTHPAHGYHFLAEVVDASVTTTSAGNDLVNVIGGSITLRAKVYDATYEREYPLTNDGLIHFGSKDKAFPPFRTWPHLDAVEDNLKKSGYTSLLPLRNQEVNWEYLEWDQSGDTNDVTCLILEKVGASKNTYRKIGWMYLWGGRSHDKKTKTS